MSKNWYPIINYDDCIECGACVEKCSHGVYDESVAPHPVIVNPDNCVEGCTGCASICPAEAIEYFSNDDNIQAKGCGCCCGGGECESEEEGGESTNSDCGCGGDCCG